MGKEIRAVDARGYAVTCSGEYWDTHVLIRHDDLIGHEDDAKRAIEKRDFIYTSASEPDRVIYYGRMTGRRPEIKVVVVFNSENIGVVLSVSACSRRPSGETPIWP
jgi:hypothetical protein